jgi:plastocyanin domain-containing protein
MSMDLPFYDSRLVVLADPGTGAAMPLHISSNIELIIAASATETNTCADPNFNGQILFLTVNSLGASGTRAITFASAINKAANTIVTFADAADAILLNAVKKGGVLKWIIVVNDGTTLS